MNLINKFTLVGVALLSQAVAVAQTSPEEIAANPGKAGGVYYAYPVTESHNTPAPKGYKPFYISHYGRHGSRYLIGDNDYKNVIDRMHDADSHNALTPLGKDVLQRLDSIWLEAKGRGGELTPLGVRQHHDIAQRMYRAYPEAFAGTPEITAASTVVMRCAHSMFAFVEGLKELNPSLVIPRESGTRNMDYLNYHSPESGKYNGHDGDWYQDYRKFRAEKTRPDRMMKSLFSDSLYVRRHIDPTEMMWSFYWITVDMQNMETKLSFYDLWEGDELFNLWEVFNFNFYACNSSYPLADGQHVDNAKNLLRNIVETADNYIAEGKNGATLRFGHDGNVIPLAALFQFENCAPYESNPYELYKVYSDFKISPMASNIQLIFFKNKQGDILVKFMLNEQEVAIPCATDNFPFYRWADARAALQQILDTPCRNYIPASALSR
jgi:hypothetical protein